MHLARHSITPTQQTLIVNARFDQDNHLFTAITPSGYAVYLARPLRLVSHRDIPNGTFAHVVPLHASNILFLVGGGVSPLYPPNKVVVWDDSLSKEVAELEFREDVRGLACRRGMLAVALRRRVVVFEVGGQLGLVNRLGEWETCDNDRGLLAFASAAQATLLAFPGRQVGHVQLLHLTPCPSPPSSTPVRLIKPPARDMPVPRHPVSIIAAHTSALTTLAAPPSGSLLATSSERGTLIRVWDSLSGKLIRELRRGADKAEIYGSAFRKDEKELSVWSDKGTVHVFSLGLDGGGPSGNRQSALAPLAPYIRLPKYFASEWSYAQYRLPAPPPTASLSLPDEPEIRCTVGWIEVPDPNNKGEASHQLIALTFSGGWYRLSIPDRPSTTSPQFGAAPERENTSRSCVLEEFRRFGRWDGWG